DRIYEAIKDIRGGLRITDQLADRIFCDFHTPSTVGLVQAGPGPDGSRQLILAKQFDGAEFTTTITYRMQADCLQWLVELDQLRGPDRSVRITFLTPQPSRRLWGPMAEPFVEFDPERPIMLRHGLAHGRAVAHQRRSLPVPIVTFIRESRCLAMALPIELPNVLVRFMNSPDEQHLNLANSLSYPLHERVHFKVCWDFLGLRRDRRTRAGLLISPHPGQWRQALAWYAARYPAHFQPDPKIRQHEGVYGPGRPMDGGADQQTVHANMVGRRRRGVKWMELHAHFPHYGLYVSPTEPWTGEHTDVQTTYEMVRHYIRLAHQQDIAIHIYYNIIDGKCWYVQEHFPDSIARNERGEKIPAFRECWLMNADPQTAFGQHCLQQFEKLLDTYPQTDGVFFDVYGRHYDIDFAHDDGITMVHNKPAYCLKFAFQRIMERIEPLLRARGKVFSANKPEGIELLKGIDYIMADEGLNQDRLEAFSYYGLFKPVMVLNGNIWQDPEETFKTCLRLGILYNDPAAPRYRDQLSPQQARRNERIRTAYAPLLRHLIGKQWVLRANALELPAPIRGNIFALPDGRYVVTMVSDHRSMFERGGYQRN
ncbi:MAG: hypothetical protein ACE5K7_07140, partial [Phycisphaerae bacterium]